MSEPTIVMTLMVRDEADVVAAMIEHHLAQGVDLIIATDNGSVDGTREILADYAETGRVELHDYLEHDKKQSQVVSAMASRAATEHGATWVVNADADEFFVAVDPSMTLREALRAIPTGIGSFEVPVTNLTGAPARRGTAFERLTWRDLREESTLMETVALHAHPTSNVIHVGRAGVTVQQGNHAVDIPSMGRPDPAHAIEVLHLPWRTYEQYSRKIDHMGRAYEASTTLNPSPRHHGMRDFRFLRAGHLEALYVVRHPGEEPGEGFEHEPRVFESVQQILDAGQALRAERLRPLLSGGWDGYEPEEREQATRVAAIVIPLELEHLAAATRWRDLYRAEAAGHRRATEQLEQATTRHRSSARRLVSRVVRALRRRAGRLLRR
jgi:hypothetical protein